MITSKIASRFFNFLLFSNFSGILPAIPSIKVPKLKKLLWRDGSVLTLSIQNGNRSNIDSYFRVQNNLRDQKPKLDIPTISSVVPEQIIKRDNYGLYALKADRNAAKKGILLNLPKKVTKTVDITEMNHEKFSPCRKNNEIVPKIIPPPRKKKLLKMAQINAEKNESELFRIAEIKRNWVNPNWREKFNNISIDNCSDKIEVRYTKVETKKVPAPLPPRVVALKNDILPKINSPPPQIVKNNLKKQWINDFLTESEDNDAIVRVLPTKNESLSESSTHSVNIFSKASQTFEEFDEIFNESVENSNFRKKSVKYNEKITYIKTQNVNNSSFDSNEGYPLEYKVNTHKAHSPPKEVKSTVKIQDFYGKNNLPRCKYVSTPSPQPVDGRFEDVLAKTNACTSKNHIYYCDDNNMKNLNNNHNNLVLPINILNSNKFIINNHKVPIINTSTTKLNNTNSRNSCSNTGVQIVGETLKNPHYNGTKFVNYKFEDNHIYKDVEDGILII